MDIKTLTIKKFQEGLRKKEFSAREVTDEYLSAIQQKDTAIGAYLSVQEEEARKEADAADSALAAGEDSPLLGVPLAIKDIILIKNRPATGASKMLEHYTAAYDAGCITKLKSEKTVFLGKTNCDEFAMGSSTENSALKKTVNPVDPERVPGGSSGGSAAAVAADMALGSLGTDTGSSIRIPASFCGIVGLRTSYGSVSRSGVMAMASSLDQVGPFAKTVEDAAILFSAITGRDPLDATSMDHPRQKSITEFDTEQTKSLRIGIPKEYFKEGMEPEVARAVESAISAYRKIGVEIKEVSLPHTRHGLAAYYVIVPAEVSSNLARYDGLRYAAKRNENERTNLLGMYLKNRGEGFGAESKRRIMLGTFVLSSGYYDAYYAKAMRARRLIANDFETAFESVDALLTPVVPTPAFKIGERVDDPLKMYLSDIYMINVNLAGLPGLSVPVKNPGSLPIGFQLIGRRFGEPEILSLGRLYEERG